MNDHYDANAPRCSYYCEFIYADVLVIYRDGRATDFCFDCARVREGDPRVAEIIPHPYY
jgi:hypothetical protein